MDGQMNKRTNRWQKKQELEHNETDKINQGKTHHSKLQPY